MMHGQKHIKLHQTHSTFPTLHKDIHSQYTQQNELAVHLHQWWNKVI